MRRRVAKKHRTLPDSRFGDVQVTVFVNNLMKDGKKTRLKLSLEAWGHYGDKASAVAKGRKILAAYQNMKVKKNKTRSA